MSTEREDLTRVVHLYFLALIWMTSGSLVVCIMSVVSAPEPLSASVIQSVSGEVADLNRELERAKQQVDSKFRRPLRERRHFFTRAVDELLADVDRHHSSLIQEKQLQLDHELTRIRSETDALVRRGQATHDSNVRVQETARKLLNNARRKLSREHWPMIDAGLQKITAEIEQLKLQKPFRRGSE